MIGGTTGDMKTLLLLLILTAYPIAWAECVIVDCENGKGTYTCSDGHKYVGGFRQYLFDGEGTFPISFYVKEDREYD